jgi:hypothetical protein
VFEVCDLDFADKKYEHIAVQLEKDFASVTSTGPVLRPAVTGAFRLP